MVAQGKLCCYPTLQTIGKKQLKLVPRSRYVKHHLLQWRRAKEVDKPQQQKCNIIHVESAAMTAVVVQETGWETNHWTIKLASVRRGWSALTLHQHRICPMPTGSAKTRGSHTSFHSSSAILGSVGTFLRAGVLNWRLENMFRAFHAHSL